MAKVSAIPMKIMAIIIMVTMLVYVGQLRPVKATECNPVLLAPCLDGIINNTPPTKECCEELNEQYPCLCTYSQNPAYGPIISSPGAHQVVESCKTISNNTLEQLQNLFLELYRVLDTHNKHLLPHSNL